MLIFFNWADIALDVASLRFITFVLFSRELRVGFQFCVVEAEGGVITIIELYE
jgi:hypothetical protein